MKRTTYIIAGMLLAGLIVIVGSLLYMSSFRTGVNSNMVEIGGEQKTIQLPECKIIQLSAVSSEVKEKKDGIVEIERSLSFCDVPLSVQPADSSAQGSFSFAGDMEQFIKMSSSGDTLRIVFDLPKEKLDKRFRDMHWLYLNSAGMMLKIPAGVQSVACNINDMTTTFKGFRRDTLSFDAAGTIVVEDCHFDALNAKGRSLKLNSGEVRDLYLNLDAISNWKTNAESFHIDTEHLSGSGEHTNFLQKGEARQVLWTPLTENASLKLTLNQAAKIDICN